MTNIEKMILTLTQMAGFAIQQYCVNSTHDQKIKEELADEFKKLRNELIYSVK